MGSRSQLASPATDKPSQNVTAASAAAIATVAHEKPQKSSMSPPEYTSTSKRESFVETRFLETLTPQFIPGNAMTSMATGGPSSAEDKLAALQQQQLADDLRTQVRDLTEKLDTVMQRRNEDKERLRDFDKMKTQFEQLQEFKAKIMDAQSQLQRDLQRARQETKDAIDARDLHAEEMSELAENVEMITLDKEMAEEKADTLQIELDAAKERCEELQLDLEIIKAEMQNKATGGIGAVAPAGLSVDPLIAAAAGMSSYEFKQMEQQNSRLRDTLVRLRDLSAHEKHEIQKISKELETTKSEVAELHRTKEKLSAKVSAALSVGKWTF